MAAVIARDEITAQRGVDLIEVDYEPLTTISDPLEALEIGEPRIHEYGEDGNIHKRVALEFGDVDAALAGADHVFEDTFFFQGNTHLPLEQHASVAAVDPDGKLTLWSSTQTPHYVHRALVKVLKMPAAHIRVIACPNGGGFGGKSDIFNHEIVVCRAALELGRPVKIALNREEVFYCHRGRHPVLMRFRTGVTNDGKVTGMHLQTLLDGGAYGSYGVASLFYTGALQTVTYHIPRYRFEGCRTFTNKPPCGPKRGHGTPQPRFGQEVQLDKIAERLSIDPADLRLGIVEKPDTVTANYLKIGTIGLGECIRRVVDGSGWREKHRKLPEGRGVGLACGSYLTGAGLPIYWNKMPHSGVQLLLDRGGSATVFCGATEIGQGSDDMLALMVAEVLGIRPADVRCVTGDTGITPVDLGSYSSRVTLMMGNAAIEAAGRARDLIASAVAEKLEVSAESLTFGGDKVVDAEGRGFSFREAVVIAEERHGTIGTVGSYTPPKSPARFKGGGVGPSPAYSYTRRSSRSRSTRSPGGSTCRTSGWLTTSAERSTRARARADRGQRLHGPRRGDHGGAGLPPAPREPLSSVHSSTRSRRCSSTRARPRTRCPPVDHVHHRATPTRTGRSAPRRSARVRCCRSCRRWPTPCLGRGGGARWTRSPITPDKVAQVRWTIASAAAASRVRPEELPRPRAIQKTIARARRSLRRAATAPRRQRSRPQASRTHGQGQGRRPHDASSATSAYYAPVRPSVEVADDPRTTRDPTRR